VPKEQEVLVKVHAASINSWDWDLLTGRPYLYRLFFGMLRPRFPVIGSDVAGTVEAVGKNTTQFKPGDEVFGDLSPAGFGAFAEYATVPEALLAMKPRSLSFEEAATLPQAGVLALQGLDYNGGVDAGQKVLINGAGGGVGAIAIQLAKHYGAEVAGVDHTVKLDAMKSWGADEVTDFTKVDFTQQGKKYDLVLDNVMYRSLRDARKVLENRGAYGVIGGKPAALIKTLLLGGLNGKSKVGIVVHRPNQKSLMLISDFVEQGALRPVIDRIFALEQAAEAMQYYREGNFKGKIVLKMD
jgi:NADPH:quinone reductase-like Zn-dependent oxidoreductase